MVKVSVPATSANLGAGFDSCGIALSLYNTASFEEMDGICITAADGSFVPQGPGNLIYHTAQEVYRLCDAPFRGLSIVQTNLIPMARGLGSSSACIAAGILGANALLKNPLSADDVLTLATQMEGHPDNVAPALRGGFVVSAFDEGKVFALQKSIAEGIAFAAFVPNFKLLTEKARAVLPKEVPYKDAVYNLSRAALLATAFCTEQYDFLSVATKDKLHQQYRLPLIAGGEDVFALCETLGAMGTFISGAGPTILAVVRADDSAFFKKANAALTQNAQLSAFTLHRFTADNAGATVE
ncbi:MAG: homoserine kinase [Ruthenibacterium sp.]